MKIIKEIVFKSEESSMQVRPTKITKSAPGASIVSDENQHPLKCCIRDGIENYKRRVNVTETDKVDLTDILKYRKCQCKKCVNLYLKNKGGKSVVDPILKTTLHTESAPPRTGNFFFYTN